MLKLTGLGVAFALAALAALGASPAVAAKSKSPNCKRSKSSTVAENRSARVFTRRDARTAIPTARPWSAAGRRAAARDGSLTRSTTSTSRAPHLIS